MSDVKEPVETLKANIERRLAERAAQDPSFITELMLHPNSILRPLISEMMGEDGGLDLSEVDTNVHVQTDRRLHFVVTVPTGEVEGYAMGLASSLTNIGSDFGGFDELKGRKKSKKCEPVLTNLCTDPLRGCPTIHEGTRNACPAGSPTFPYP